MSKRDLIREIEAKKLRSPGYNDAALRLFLLQHSFTQHEKAVIDFNAAWGLFLVGIVGCIEVAVRDALRRLIDYGPPYVDRISEFKDLLRLDINIARALQDKRLSFGDLFSHLLPVSTVEQINSHFGTLFQRDFRQVLADAREFVEPSFSELLDGEEQEELEPAPEADADPEDSESYLLPIPDVGALMASLVRLFRARHNAAHEADFESVSADDVRGFFRTAEIFIHAMDETVSQALEPNIPRSAIGTSLLAAQEAGKVHNEMQALEAKLVSLLPDESKLTPSVGNDDGELSELKAYRKAQEAFEKHLDAETTFNLVRVGAISGNGMRMLEAETLKDFCEFRIKRLKEAVEHIELLSDTNSGPPADGSSN